MTDDRKKFDDLICGNCGFDGGEAHLKEKLAMQQKHAADQLEWQRQLNVAKNLSDVARRSRHTAVTFSIMIVTIGTIIGIWIAKPDAPKQEPNPVVEKILAAQKMYEACVSQINYMEKNEKAAAIDGCNKSFKTELDSVDLSAKEDK